MKVIAEEAFLTLRFFTKPITYPVCHCTASTPSRGRRSFTH